jgi:hypothetical protein
MNDHERFKILYEDTIKIAIKTTSNFPEYNNTHGPVNKGCWDCTYSPHGECRMITCLCCENEPENDESVDEWFVGSCDRCEDEIFNKYLALRIPCEEGGWLGCFCSLQCINEVYLDGDDDKNPIRESLLVALEQNLTDYPIDIDNCYSEEI